MTGRILYDTDLTDDEWEHLKPLVPGAKPGGRPPKHSRREILNGIFYTVRSGGAWKLLPHDLPPWRTVYHYFWLWRRNGTWQRIHDTIRASVRKAAGRHRERSGAVVDSQSAQTSEQGGIRGYDAAKNVSGRKRHILVDTLGLVLLVVVTAANAGPDSGTHPAGDTGHAIPALACGLGRWRLCRWRSAPLGSPTPAVGKGSAGDRPQAKGTAGLCGSAVAMDCRAHVCVAGPMATAQGRLRVLAGNHRSAHSHCDDPAHAAKTGTDLTFSNALSAAALF